MMKSRFNAILHQTREVYATFITFLSMETVNRYLRENWAISVLVLIKLTLHLIAISRYGFHRDEFLYLVQGDHLQWGYLEVPPVTAFIGRIATTLFGTELIGIRLFPLIASLYILWLVGKMIRLMGGSNLAVFVGGLAFIFSPAFLRSGLLFQPVVFNQLCWTLIAYLIMRILVNGHQKTWYALGVVIGIAVLVKYSAAFYLLAMIGGALLTPQRSWFLTRWPYLAVGIALLISLPNLIWQWEHSWPIIRHMDELTRTQLRYVSPTGFMTGQILMHFSGLLIWVAGLIYCFQKKGARYRIFGWAYLFTIMLLLSGKSYYSLGAYPVLMAMGGVAWTQWYGSKRLVGAIAVLTVLLGLVILPYGLPVLSVEKMKNYGLYMADHYGLEGPLIWEDGVRRDLPQDYADMFGWEEMVAKTADFYHGLDPAIQGKTMIYGGGYSHTATANFYREKYDLPEIYSMNNSFVFWAPLDLDFDTQIELDDRLQTESAYFEEVRLVDSIENIYAREPGFILLKTKPTVNIPETWRELLMEARAEFNVR